MSKPRLKVRSDGRYRCYYKGKQFYGATQAEAYAKRDEYKALLHEGITPGKTTVTAFAKKWLPIACASVAPSTYNGNARMLEIACEEIGDMTFQEVKPSDIKALFTKRFSTYSDSYIIHAKALYTSLFDAAIDDGLIRTNPCKTKSAKPHKGTIGSHRAITQEERYILENAATDNRVYPIAMLMLYGGLRPAEAVPFRAENIDFENNVLYVNEFSHFESSGKRFVTKKGKTEKSTRKVPLFSPLKNVLIGKEGVIFKSKTGSYLSKSGWYNAWKRYISEIETSLNGMTRRKYNSLVKEGKKKASDWVCFTVRPYDLRHTFVTWCRDNGVELHTVVEWCGHKDAKMILKIYDKVSHKRWKSEQDKLEEKIKSDSKTTENPTCAVQNTVQSKEGNG